MTCHIGDGCLSFVQSIVKQCPLGATFCISFSFFVFLSRVLFRLFLCFLKIVQQTKNQLQPYEFLIYCWIVLVNFAITLVIMSTILLYYHPSCFFISHSITSYYYIFILFYIVLDIILSVADSDIWATFQPKLEKQKKSTLNKFLIFSQKKSLYFGKWNFPSSENTKKSTPKKFLIFFSLKCFSYISGNTTF